MKRPCGICKRDHAEDESGAKHGTTDRQCSKCGRWLKPDERDGRQPSHLGAHNFRCRAGWLA